MFDWKSLAEKHGWREVAHDPRPEYADLGPCLYHAAQDRSFPLGDWRGAVIDLGVVIRCNRCLWHGDEDSLIRCEDASGDGTADACPNCRTDHFLMDLNGTEMALDPSNA